MIVRRVDTAGSVVVGDIVGIVVIGVVSIVEPTNGHRRGVTRGARPGSRLWSWQG